MSKKAVIIGAGLVSAAGVALAVHFRQKASECPDNNDIFCPDAHDQTGIMARADAHEHLACLTDVVPQFQGPNYALDGQ